MMSSVTREQVDIVCNNARVHRALHSCDGDPNALAVAFRGAVIAWLMRGSQVEKKAAQKDADDLRRGIRKANQHAAAVIAKLEQITFDNPATGDCISLAPWLGLGVYSIPAEDVLKAVLGAIEGVADDLEQRQPKAMELRKDTRFLRLLGAEFKRLGLSRPKASQLQELYELATGEILTDDSEAIHAFDRGNDGEDMDLWEL